MKIKSTILAAAALLLAGLMPAQATTVTDTSAEVMLYAGDIIAESYAPASDTAGFDPVYALVSGGILGFDPAFVLSLEDASGEVIYGETDSYLFDGEATLSFVFDITGSAASNFGSSLNLSFLFDDSITDPFGDLIDIYTTATMVISPVSVTNVPLPAGLPLLVSGFGVIALLRRRRA